LTKVNINNCLQQVTEDFRIDSDRMSAVQMLSDRLSDIMDQKVRSAFSKVMAFQSKYYDLRERRASDNVSDLAAIIYRIKNQDKKLTQSIDFKATILNNLIKRKQRILSKEIEDVFEKYPLLPMTYNARRLPKEEFIKYINVFYQCHQTTQQEKTA
jgi:hypothetical protein